MGHKRVSTGREDVFLEGKGCFFLLTHHTDARVGGAKINTNGGTDGGFFVVVVIVRPDEGRGNGKCRECQQKYLGQLHVLIMAGQQ
jgi:hypothetical protein